jgi:hypothetical protein
MGDADGDANTPTPEQVLEVFQSEKCGPVQVTDKIRQLAGLLDQAPALAEFQKRSADAYRGWQILWDALFPFVVTLRDIAKIPIGGPDEAAQDKEYRNLSRLLNALKATADTSFIRGGREFAGDTPWAHACMATAAGVVAVLEQSGAKNLGFSEQGPVCRVTAELARRFLNRPTATANAVSALLRRQRKLRNQPEPPSDNSDQGGNETKS